MGARIRIPQISITGTVDVADKIYPKARAQAWTGALDLRAGTMRALLLDGTYAYNDSHAFLSDVSGIARVKASQPMTGRAVNLTTSNFDSDDPTVQAVTGDDVEQIILYLDTGIEVFVEADLLQGHGDQHGAVHARRFRYPYRCSCVGMVQTMSAAAP